MCANGSSIHIQPFPPLFYKTHPHTTSPYTHTHTHTHRGSVHESHGIPHCTQADHPNTSHHTSQEAHTCIHCTVHMYMYICTCKSIHVHVHVHICTAETCVEICKAKCHPTYVPAKPAAAPQETKSLFSLLEEHMHTFTHI